jgi:hypothetical protein
MDEIYYCFLHFLFADPARPAFQKMSSHFFHAAWRQLAIDR